MKLLTSELKSIWSQPRHLMVRVSFEERSIEVAKSAPPGMCAGGIIFASEGRSDRAQQHVEAVRAIHPNLELVELKISDPLSTAVALHGAIAKHPIENSVVDVTSFRREELLVLLQALRDVPNSRMLGCDLAYVSADKMADTLSGKVVQCRSVVGYAGEIWPSKPTRLVVLMGFEEERARAIIEAYEPRSLILGKGRASDSINQELSRRNDAFFRELQSSYDNVEATFEFSARDPRLVADELDRAIPEPQHSNVILAPLHTKLSTIGVGLYAQRHVQAQICYAEVGGYNEDGYSTVGSDAYVLSLTELLL